MAATPASFLDLKTLGKVVSFNGKPEEWPIWSFKFECWLGLVPDIGSSNVADVMERAGNAVDVGALDMSTFGAEAKQVATSIFYLLVQLVGGRALAIVRKVVKGNGLLAWYRRKKEYEDSGGHRSVALLMGLMSPQWPKDLTAKQFADKLDEWETDTDMYEKQTSEMLNESIKVAVVLKHAPTEIQGALRMQMATIHDDYDALRNTVQLMARGLTEYNSRGVSSSGHDNRDGMDVDSSTNAVSGKGGKNKDKGYQKGGKVKGKTKDKSKSKTKFEGTCFVCGKAGHM